MEPYCSSKTVSHHCFSLDPYGHWKAPWYAEHVPLFAWWGNGGLVSSVHSFGQLLHQAVQTDSIGWWLWLDSICGRLYAPSLAVDQCFPTGVPLDMSRCAAELGGGVASSGAWLQSVLPLLLHTATALCPDPCCNPPTPRSAFGFSPSPLPPALLSAGVEWDGKDSVSVVWGRKGWEMLL